MKTEQRTGLNEFNQNQQVPKLEILQQEETDKNFPHVKPLTPQQHAAINSLRGKVQKSIMELLLAKREERRITTIEDIIVFISFESNDTPYLEKVKRARQDISTLNKTTIKDVGLLIQAIKTYDPEKNRYKTFYCLLTEHELAQMSQNALDELSTYKETEQFFTYKEIGETVNILNEHTLRGRIRSARIIDPSIKPLYLDPRRPNKPYFSNEDRNKLVKLIPQPTKNGQVNGPITQKKEKAQDNNPPFSEEHDARTMLGKSREQIREEAKMDSAIVILSHLTNDCMKELTKDPGELLENLLPPYNHIAKTKLESVISEPPKQFVVDSLTKVLEAFWNKDPSHVSSVNETRILAYCLKLSKKGYNMETTVGIVHEHFLGADSTTYAAAH